MTCCFGRKEKRNTYKGLREKLQCPICCEFLKTTVVTQCSHYFCEICLARRLFVEDNCPTCKEQQPSFRSSPDVDCLIAEFLEEDEVLMWNRLKRSTNAGRAVVNISVGADVDIQDSFGRWHAGKIKQILADASPASKPLLLVKQGVTIN